MSENPFPFKGAEGDAVTIDIGDDYWSVSPTERSLDGAEGVVLEAVDKDVAGITSLSVARIELDGEQYIVSEHNETAVMLHDDGTEAPIQLAHIIVE